MADTVQLVPVLDLMNGAVVRGVAGQRDEYRPIQSRLAAGSDPVQIAAALRDGFRVDEFYVADLDAIRFHRPQLEVIARLANLGLKLLVDGGISDIATAEKLVQANAARVISGLETLPDWTLLRELVGTFGSDQIVFSVDLQNGRPLGQAGSGLSPAEIVNRAVDAGIVNLIVLDLAGVGVGGGIPTLELCSHIREEHPDLTLWTGGGVRNMNDVLASRSYGVSGVLVASALHDGRIPAIS